MIYFIFLFYEVWKLQGLVNFKFKFNIEMFKSFMGEIFFFIRFKFVSGSVVLFYDGIY